MKSNSIHPVWQMKNGQHRESNHEIACPFLSTFRLVSREREATKGGWCHMTSQESNSSTFAHCAIRPCKNFFHLGKPRVTQPYRLIALFFWGGILTCRCDAIR